LVLAHRGASLIRPENTLAAFRAAIGQGADGFELDVQLSRDGEVVVFHDVSLERVTGHTGRVEDLRAAELLALDVGSHFGPDFAGERMPLLEEVLAEFGPQITINIEIKNHYRPFNALVQRLADLINQAGDLPRILLSSFNPLALWQARRMIPGLPLGLLLAEFEPRGFRWLLRRALRYDTLHLQAKLIRAGEVAREHRRGHKVVAWLVDEAAHLRWLQGEGVDAVIVTDPRAAREVLRGGA
jgi:glycerophosphoryl diester phosphodiesterase